ncbi:hypothetical protein ACFCV3_41600 [Kribbella sp. NPDC056345]|uniref:hypothetical protein n=1 Tax=Kribbella sp. NPDC056345 TaxID=3345789 RepID=UPI0035DDFD1F
MPDALVYGLVPAIAVFLGMVGWGVMNYLTERAKQPQAGAGAAAVQEPSADRLATSYADGQTWYRLLQTYFTEQANRQRASGTFEAAQTRLDDAQARFLAGLNYLSVCTFGPLHAVVTDLITHVDQLPDSGGYPTSPGHQERVKKFLAESDQLLATYQAAARSEIVETK